MKPVIRVDFNARWSQSPNPVEFICPFVLEWFFLTGGQLSRKVCRCVAGDWVAVAPR